MSAAILSARPVTACVLDSGCVVSGPREALRPPAVGLPGQFTINGLQLIGPSGEGCGTFVTKQLAQATADHLNR